MATQYTDLDLDHIQPAGVFGNIVELQPAQHPSRFASGESLVECAGRMRRQIVLDHPDALRLGKVNVSEFAHAGSKVHRGTAVGDFDLAPGPMHVEENEQVGRPIAFILAVVTLELARLGRDRFGSGSSA